MIDSPTTHGTSANGDHRSDLLLEAVLMFGQRLTAMEHDLTEVKNILVGQRIEKEWYTSGELAEALGKSQYTVQERWCHEGRIECQKDLESGKWRIAYLYTCARRRLSSVSAIWHTATR